MNTLHCIRTNKHLIKLFFHYFTFGIKNPLMTIEPNKSAFPLVFPSSYSLVTSPSDHCCYVVLVFKASCQTPPQNKQTNKKLSNKRRKKKRKKNPSGREQKDFRCDRDTSSGAKSLVLPPSQRSLTGTIHCDRGAFGWDLLTIDRMWT